MTAPIITVNEDKRVGEAVDLMLKHNLKRLPVVDSNEQLTGFLARSDIFQTITNETPDWEAMCAMNVCVDGVKYVKDIMRRDTHTVAPDAAIEEVIELLIQTIFSGSW